MPRRQGANTHIHRHVRQMESQRSKPQVRIILKGTNGYLTARILCNQIGHRRTNFHFAQVAKARIARSTAFHEAWDQARGLEDK